jgi:UDP-N-acetylmuramoyl-L-alanyl-D-glutamate--2,6-diaminopimelate ligase
MKKGITGLQYDSRKIKKNNMYFALSGLHVDGHAYIADALLRGAAAVVYEKDPGEWPPQKIPRNERADPNVIGRFPDASFYRVKDSRFALSPVAAAFYGFPAKQLVCIGVTGTEGKSTTVYLIWQLLCLAGKKAGFISTVQFSLGGGAEWNSEHQTTPEATEIHKKLAAMRDNGCEYAVIEASSHGLSKKTNRLGDVPFSGAVMTNVTHEHLEFHGTWEQYRSDKANLFRSLGRFGVINACDKSAEFFVDASPCRTALFSASPGFTGAADIALASIESFAGGNRYQVSIAGQNRKIIDIEDKLPGAFNAGNVLAALLVCAEFTKKPVAELAALVPRLLPVRGRMTAVDRGQDFEVMVDYAHTPSSFEAIFPSIRGRLDKSGGRIISLFGSAGERDTKKRPEQGSIAARYSDIVILSDEDPRGEDPLAILEEIAAGIKDKIRGESLFLVPCRKAAIRKAFSLAKTGDLVLLLGKGHENSIIYGGYAMPYDEIAEAQNALDETGERNV